MKDTIDYIVFSVLPSFVMKFLVNLLFILQRGRMMFFCP